MWASAASIRAWSSASSAKREQTQIVGPVLALAGPGADDHRGHRRLLEHPARGDVGDRDAVPARHLGQRREHALQHRPAADGVDEALVLHLAPVADLRCRRLGRAEPAVGEEAAGERAVGQQADPVLPAEVAHLLAGTAVEQREADLVGRDLDPLAGQHAQMVGVEIGHPQLRDPALAAQRHQLAHRIEIGRVLEQPPMQLQQVDPVDAEASETAADAGAHHVAGHLPGHRAPFGEHGGPGGSGRQPAEQPADNVLRTAVMVGHVEAVEACRDVVGQRVGRPVLVQWAAVTLHVGHLPQAGHDPADLEARAPARGGPAGSRAAAWFGLLHTMLIDRRQWRPAAPAGLAASARRRRARPAPARSARPAARPAAARNSGPGSGPSRPA